MQKIYPWQSRLCPLHRFMFGLLPLAIFVVWFCLVAFPRIHWTSQKAVELTSAPTLQLTAKPEPEPDPSRAPTAAAPRLTKPLIDPRIVVHKRSRHADLYSGDKLIKSYKIALGPNPDGNKTRKGDGRTPEGQYRLCSRLERSRYHIFLGLNYPTLRDAEQGLKNQTITKKDAMRITEAERKREMPPWDTPLSGAIGLHGGGNDSDWTLGCIAFDNRDIEELLTATRHWTPVEIRP